MALACLFVGYAALAWLNAALLVLILWRGWTEKIWSDFRAFYIYAAYSALHILGAGVILMTAGINSELYRTFYYSANTLSVFVGAWFFFDALRSLAPSSEAGVRLARTFLLTALALTVPVLWALVDVAANPFDRLQAISLIYKLAVCLVAFCYLAEHREIELGSNLGGLLVGMGLLTGSQSLNFISYFGGEIRLEVFRVLVPALYSATMLILLFSLWQRDPVRFNASRRNLNLQVQQIFRSFLTR